MTAASNEELIDAAQAVLNPHAVDGRLLGDVASTLVTDRGTRYFGVCIDTASGTGFCAEHSAIAAMVTAGEYRIAKWTFRNLLAARIKRRHAARLATPTAD